MYTYHGSNLCLVYSVSSFLSLQDEVHQAGVDVARWLEWRVEIRRSYVQPWESHWVVCFLGQNQDIPSGHGWYVCIYTM